MKPYVCMFMCTLYVYYIYTGGKISQACVILYTSGTCIMDGVLIADFVGAALGRWIHSDSPLYILTNRGVILLIAGVTFLMPLALQKNIDSLKNTSVLSLICTCYVIGLAVNNPNNPNSSNNPLSSMASIWNTPFKAC